MSYPNHFHIGFALKVGRLPWLLFLFLTAVFFLGFHDLSYAKKEIGNYNMSQDEMVASVVEGSLGHRIALLSLGIVAIFSLIRHRTNRSLHIDGLLGWILLSFVVWAFISSLWAADSLLTLKRLVAFGILCIAALATVRRLSLREIILWIFFTTAVFLFIGFLAELLFGTFKPLASGFRFAGSLHPNAQGINCGLLLLSGVAAAEVERRWRALFWTCAFLGLVFLVLTGSRTALAAAVLALVVHVAAASSRKSKIAMACSLSIASCFLLLFLGARSLPGLKSAIPLGRDDPYSLETFNGRTMVWEDVNYYIRQRPLLGYGYDGFWTPTHISVISNEEKQGVSSCHSTYIEYLLSLGIVGLLSYTILLLAGIWRAFHRYRLSQSSVFAFCGALLVFCALAGLLDSVVADQSILMFLWMVVLAWLAFIDLSGKLVEFSGR
jgi:O-antigen ligase